ncbi:MAG: RNA-binding protein [Desulfurococcaceae archaeon]
MRESPDLIVTCRTSSVELCKQEVGNVIFRRDQRVKIEETPFRGVLFIYTSLGPDRAYAVSSRREYGFVESIIPVHCALKSPPPVNELAECLEKVVKLSEIKLRVKSRGLRGVSTDIFKSVSEVISRLGGRHSPQAQKCLYVEVFRDSVYVGLGDCLSVFKSRIE